MHGCDDVMVCAGIDVTLHAGKAQTTQFFCWWSVYEEFLSGVEPSLRYFQCLVLLFQYLLNEFSSA